MPPPETTPRPVTRFSIDRPAGEFGYLARLSLGISPPAVSPEGRLLVFATTDGLLVREMDRFEARLIPDTERAEVPFFSPDGQWIGYRSIFRCHLQSPGRRRVCRFK